MSAWSASRATIPTTNKIPRRRPSAVGANGSVSKLLMERNNHGAKVSGQMHVADAQDCGQVKEINLMQ